MNNFSAFSSSSNSNQQPVETTDSTSSRFGRSCTIPTTNQSLSKSKLTIDISAPALEENSIHTVRTVSSSSQSSLGKDELWLRRGTTPKNMCSYEDEQTKKYVTLEGRGDHFHPVTVRSPVLLPRLSTDDSAESRPNSTNSWLSPFGSPFLSLPEDGGDTTVRHEVFLEHLSIIFINFMNY
jgi:hypothetical protein